MSQSIDENKDTVDLSGNRICFNHSLTKDEVDAILREVNPWLKKSGHAVIRIDLNKLVEMDSAGAATIFYLQDLIRKRKKKCEIYGASPSIQSKLDLFTPTKPAEEHNHNEEGFFERIGTKTLYIFYHAIGGYIRMTADIFFWSGTDLFRKRKYRKGEVVKQALHVGVNAVPIVISMSFIIGLVLALQSAAQLRDFGANVYIVDLIVIAMMSEMGPLITAILVAGRSGSAIAAEIATMKVTSELDALKTMGMNPLRFVVVPKMYGSLLTMPFLTILASIAGIIGGLTTAYFYLDVTPEIFYARMGNALYNKDIITGIVKSIVFAALIVLTGSYYGLRVDRGAEGVGRVTTHAVVASIALVIVADSIMSLLFY